MIRINSAYFYELGARLHPLLNIDENGDRDDLWLALYMAQNSLRAALFSEVIPLRTCVARGWQLDEAISRLIQLIRDPAQAHVDTFEFDRVETAAKEFETVLQAELQVMSAYYASQKALYSTPDLVDRAEIIFPKEVRDKVSEDAINDVRQAGKCLAFDVPTAAGFHILRATEDIIREYYGLVVGTLPAKKSRNWGVYIKGLRAHGADQKIVAALEQVKDMHRNPIMHPEVVLTTDEAISLFGIAQGIIVAMVLDIEKRKAAAAATAAIAAVPPPPVLPPANP